MSQEEFQTKVLSHLNSLSNGLEAMNLRLNAVASRLESIEKRLDLIEDRLRKIEKFVATDNADFPTS